MLEGKLQAAISRTDYPKLLEQNGYRVSSINADKPEYIEYEIVKGDHSCEVQVDLDPKTKTTKKVDVTTNVWKAKSSERAQADNKGMAPATEATSRLPGQTVR